MHLMLLENRDRSVDEANGALNDTERLHTSMSLYFDWMLSQIPDE